MNTTQEAAAVRQALKSELKLTTKQVSVRKGSGGHSINVYIHDPCVELSAVESIARRAESIQRCEITGEIMQGGNTFVFVEYSDKAEHAVMVSHSAMIEDIMGKAKQLEPCTGEDINGASIVRDGFQYYMQLVGDWLGSRSWFSCDHASSIARALLSLGINHFQPVTA